MKKEVSLPKNRIELFIDLIKDSWRELFSASLVFALYLLPITLVVILSFIYQNHLMQGVDPNNQAAVLEAATLYYQLQITSIVVLIPLFILLSYGFCGLTYVIKSIIWGKRVEIFKGFLQSSKENHKFIIFNGIILSLIYGANICTYWLVEFNNFETNINIFIYVIIILISLLLFIQVMCGYHQMVMYDLTFIGYIKNNIIFSILGFFKYVIVIIGLLLPALLGLLFDFTSAVIFVYSIYGLIGFGVFALGTFLTSLHYFDKVINKTNYPEIYKKGLAKGE